MSSFLTPLVRSSNVRQWASLYPRSAPSFTIAHRAYTTTPADAQELSDGERHIWEKLTRELQPSRLRVMDMSGGCGSMYAIDIASEAFQGVPMIKQHRMVNEILKEELKAMHGMQLKTSAK